MLKKLSVERVRVKFLCLCKIDFCYQEPQPFKAGEEVEFIMSFLIPDSG